MFWIIRLACLLLGLAALAGSPLSAEPAGGAPSGGAALLAALPAPQWVGAADLRGRVQLTWIRNPAFTAVRVYRRLAETSGRFDQIADVNENSYLDAAVDPGRTYRYRLAGVDVDGREGAPSSDLVVRVSAVSRRAPEPPDWEGYLALGDGVGLKWSARAAEDVIAYNIYRRSPPSKQYQLVGSARGTSYRDVGLEPGRLYVYALTALDSEFRETAFSAELEVPFQPPQAEPQRRVAPEWVVRRTRLVALVSGGDIPFARPADVAVGPVSGDVYVADSGRNRVFVFNGQGVFQRAVGIGLSGAPSLKNVLGLAFDAAENLHAVDAGAGVVQLFSMQGRPGRRFELPPDAAGTGLIDAAVGADGRVYVVDNRNSRVSILEREGDGAQVFGRPGFNGGEFSAPTFCALDAAGNLHVSDALNARVQVFSPRGEFLRAFGRAEKGPGGFGRPKGIAVSAGGEVFVADSWLNTVQVFDAAGRFAAVLGDEAGKPLDLGSPNGVALGPGNRIYVAERLSARLQIREFVDAR